MKKQGPKDYNTPPMCQIYIHTHIHTCYTCINHLWKDTHEINDMDVSGEKTGLTMGRD